MKKTLNMKNTSVLPIYNTTRLNTDVFCRIFQNKKGGNLVPNIPTQFLLKINVYLFNYILFCTFILLTSKNTLP